MGQLRDTLLKDFKDIFKTELDINDRINLPPVIIETVKNRASFRPVKKTTAIENTSSSDIVSLELFEDFLGLKLHLIDDFLPSNSSKRCYFLSLKHSYFEDLLCFLFFLLLSALLYISL